MSKFIYLTTISICLALFGHDLIAQNVNVDNLRFKYKVRYLPKNPLEPRSFYYVVNTSMPPEMRDFVDEPMLRNRCRIEGQRQAESFKQGDVVVDMALSPVNVLNAVVRERSVKDRKGRRLYYFWIEVTYTSEASVIVSKGSKELMRFMPMSYRESITFRSEEYGSFLGAAAYWKNNSEMLMGQFTRECANIAVDKASDMLSLHFGFPLITEPALIKTINEKNHPENLPLLEMSSSIETKVSSLSGDHVLTEEDMAQEIVYFKDILTRYTDNVSKADIRLRYVAYYNLCRIYMYINQPEKVKEWADLLALNGHDKKDGERLIKDAQNLIDRFKYSDIKTCQFNPDAFFTD